SKFSLFAWKKKFEQEGPAGLMDKPKGTPPGSRLPELTKRTILMLKQANPDWGCQKISDMLVRGPALPASASAVAKVLHEAGYQEKWCQFIFLLLAPAGLASVMPCRACLDPSPTAFPTMPSTAATTAPPPSPPAPAPFAPSPTL